MSLKRARHRRPSCSTVYQKMSLTRATSRRASTGKDRRRRLSPSSSRGRRREADPHDHLQVANARLTPGCGHAELSRVSNGALSVFLSQAHKHIRAHAWRARLFIGNRCNRRCAVLGIYTFVRAWKRSRACTLTLWGRVRVYEGDVVAEASFFSTFYVASVVHVSII